MTNWHEHIADADSDYDNEDDCESDVSYSESDSMCVLDDSSEVILCDEEVNVDDEASDGNNQLFDINGCKKYPLSGTSTIENLQQEVVSCKPFEADMEGCYTFERVAKSKAYRKFKKFRICPITMEIPKNGYRFEFDLWRKSGDGYMDVFGDEYNPDVTWETIGVSFLGLYAETFTDDKKVEEYFEQKMKCIYRPEPKLFGKESDDFIQFVVYRNGELLTEDEKNFETLVIWNIQRHLVGIGKEERDIRYFGENLADQYDYKCYWWKHSEGETGCGYQHRCMAHVPTYLVDTAICCARNEMKECYDGLPSAHCTES